MRSGLLIAHLADSLARLASSPGDRSCAFGSASVVVRCLKFVRELDSESLAQRATAIEEWSSGADWRRRCSYQPAIESKLSSVWIAREGRAQVVVTGRGSSRRRVFHSIKYRQISPGWLKIGLGTSKTIPYFTSV